MWISLGQRISTFYVGEVEKFIEKNLINKNYKNVLANYYGNVIHPISV